VQPDAALVRKGVDGGTTPDQANWEGEQIKFEHIVPNCILSAVSKLTRIAAVVALALWGLASMHCKLEAVPGLEFLRSCCFADAASDGHKDCESDGCSAVEDGNYRAEEQNVSAPQPVLLPALLSTTIEAPLPGFEAHPFVAPTPPPELPRSWQFSFRTALAPRAPSLIG
jgi:hypothetical protein